MPARLGELFALFLRHANLTFGGGSATIAVLRRQLVDRRRWLTPLDADLAYALSRLTPGTNLLAFCSAAGWMCRRWAGALVALFGASLPCSVVAVLAARSYVTLAHDRVVQAALRGALAAAVAITVATAWTFARPHLRGAWGKALVIVPATLVLSLRTSLAPVHVLLGAAVLGLLWPAADEP